MILLSNFENSLEKLVKISDITNIAIAVSGGADSLCLASLTKELSDRHKIKIVAIIVDHKLRSESSNEAKLTSQTLNIIGLENHIFIWNHDYIKSNIQAKAREIRYEILIKYCIKNNIKYLMTGHNLEDQAETILMRIMRGSGIDGVCGIPKSAIIRGIKILRPLMEFSRSEIEETLVAKQIPWVNDPSNNDEKYKRSQIRNILNSMPEKHEAIKRINLLSEHATRARDYLEQTTKQVFCDICDYNKYGYITISTPGFLKLHEEIGLRLICLILKHMGNLKYPIRYKSIKKLYTELIIFHTDIAIKKDMGDESIYYNKQFSMTLSGCEIISSRDKIICFRESRAIKDNIILQPNTEILWDNRFLISTKQKNLVARPIKIREWPDIKLKTNNEYYKELDIFRIIRTLPAIFSQEQNVFLGIPTLEIGEIDDTMVKLKHWAI